MKLECSAMAMFTGDFLLLEQVRVIGGWAILGSSGEDELSRTLAEAKGEAMSMVDHKNLLVDLGDGAVFDLAELGGMSFPSAQQLKDGYGVCRASDGRSWYYLIYNVIRRMHRSGDRLVVSDVNHSFLEVHDFIVDRDNNICALSSSGWTYDAILFFNDGSLDEWPQSRLLQFPNEQTFSYGNQWFSLTNDAFDASGSYRESPTLLSKVWVEGKELKFKQIWSGDDGSLSKYLVLPVSEEEYYIIGGSGRLKVNIRTDAAVYERFPSVFPEHFSGYVWMADNGWGLIPRDEDVNGVIERVGVDAYNIYTMEHFYIPVPGGAGNIRGCEQGKDVVYVESSRWNELQGKWDVWISKIDIRNQQVTALSEGMSEICIL